MVLIQWPFYTGRGLANVWGRRGLFLNMDRGGGSINGDSVHFQHFSPFFKIIFKANYPFEKEEDLNTF